MYGLLVVQAAIPQSQQTVFEIVALTIAVSIVAHSMTDVPVARAFDVEELAGLPSDIPDDVSSEEGDGHRGPTADQPPDPGR